MQSISYILAFLLLFKSTFACGEDKKQEPEIVSSGIMTIESFEVSNNKTQLLLNNGSLWTYNDVDLFNVSKGWLAGDRVEIFYANFGGYYLKNASYQGSVDVTLTNPADVKTTRIQKIIKNGEKSTNKIILDDKSEWFIGSWSSSWIDKWLEGDKIIVSPSAFVFGNADHILINLDRLVGYVRAQLLHSPQLVRYEDLNKRPANIWKINLISLWTQADSCIIEMDNKTLWRCTLPKKEWNIGDELTLEEDRKKIKIENLSSKEKIEGDILNTSSKEIQTQYVKQITKNGKIILSDDSIWSIGKSGWEVGNRIIVVPLRSTSYGSSTHRLLNIDKIADSSSRISYSATLIH